jgi:hypothetical protein
MAGSAKKFSKKTFLFGATPAINNDPSLSERKKILQLHGIDNNIFLFFCNNCSIYFFRKCALISAHYALSDVFDNLVISLCKFTTLLNAPEVCIFKNTNALVVLAIDLLEVLCH